MNYITLVGKILSKQKTPDRHTLVSLFKPRDNAEKEHGMLYFVLEIMSPDPAMARVIKMIETTVIEEYYQDLTSGIDSLEMALKKVNERLTYLADEGEVGWIGKINGVIAALEGNILHITQSGTSEAYLVRDERITHVTENLSTASEKPNPLTTFINIASGNLELADRVIVSTSELFYHFSIDDLRRIIAKFTPAAAASYIVKSLRREEVESINALILELVPENEVLGQAENPNDAAWFGEEEAPAITLPKANPSQVTQKITPIIQFFVRRSQETIEKSLEKSKVVYQEQISVGVNKFSQEASRRVSEKIQDFQKKNTEEKESKNDATQETSTVPPIFGNDALKPVPQQDLFSVPKQNPLIPIFEKAKVVSKKARDYVNASRERSQLFVLVSLLLIVALVASGGYSYQSKKTETKKQEISDQYQAIKTKSEGAMKAQKLGDDVKARALLSEAQTSIQGILSSAYMQKDIKELSAQIDTYVEQLFNIARVADPKVVVNFNQVDPTVKVDGLYKKGDGFITFDRERAGALFYNGATNAVEKIEGLYFEGTYKDLVATDDGNAYFATTTPNEVYSYNATNNSISQGTQVSGDTWPKASAIATYFTNIYLAVPEEKQIYKFNGLAGNFGSKTPYIVDAGGLDLSKVVDIAIDGSVFALTSDGQVAQFLSGAKTPFQITGMPAVSKSSDPNKVGISGLISPIKLVVEKDAGMIYVADSGARRVVIFNKEGVYQRQFISDKFTDMKDIWVDSNNRKLFVLSGTEVFELPL
ncbi:MAG: hypothetical protein WC045_03985 [Patescibacteria group bacterium]